MRVKKDGPSQQACESPGVIDSPEIDKKGKDAASVLVSGALQTAILNSANFSSIATDEKGVIQLFNVGAECMLGYTAEEVIGKITPADISDPDEVIARARTLSLEQDAQIAPGFEALSFKASRGIEDIYELTYIRKDGSRFPAIVSITALRNAKDGIIGFLLIGTDNTAHKQVEADQKLLDQQLRDHQFYTRSLFESNIDAIMTTNPSGIITDVNKQMEELTGCTRDELIGAPFKDHFTNPERAAFGISRVLNEKKVTNYELTACAIDGKETVVSMNATTFYDRNRKLQGVFAAVRDVTELKRFEATLHDKNAELEVAKTTAENANRSKSDFLSHMSHELRSPLNAILGFTQLMESESPPPSLSQQESINQIMQAGWHLLNLINEILDLAKIESGKLSLSLEPVSVSEILLECQTMVQTQADKHGVSLSFVLPDHPCYLQTDRTRVKQILINLLSNAIKYNRKAGKVSVECQVQSEGRTRILVTDTGEGLSPMLLKQLFQSFNRLGQEHRTEEGTGIGLVVAKQLVELMGGTIGVESTVGVGSTFWFELAAGSAPAGDSVRRTYTANESISVPDENHRRKILYIEDNPANQKLIEQLIARRDDLQLFLAGSGREGIGLAMEKRPDMILMDINLPDITGFEALKTLRENPVTAGIPVMALSANAMPGDIRKGMDAGFVRYLTKPVKVKELMDALDAMMDGSDGLTI